MVESASRLAQAIQMETCKTLPWIPGWIGFEPLFSALFRRFLGDQAPVAERRERELP